MKIKRMIYIAPILLTAAGCAHHEYQRSQAKFDDNLYPGYTGFGSTGAGNTGASSASATGTQAGKQSGQTSATLYSSDIFSTNPQDNVLVGQIRQSIQKDESLSAVAPKIQIGANSGTVTLMGNVDNEQQKQAVESVARQASGVTSVDNKIEVSSRMASVGTGEGNLSPTSRTDNNGQRGSADILGAESGMSETFSPTSRTNSSSRIYHDAEEQGGSTNDLSATSREDSSSSIYSSGQSGTSSNQVDSTSEQLSPTSTRLDQSSSTYGSDTNSSGSLQSGQTGDVNVKVQGSTQNDRTLAQQISQELRADSSLASALSQVSVAVTDGKVTLQGSVKNAEQKRQIESAIQRITGVSSVDNQLQVGSDQSTPQNQ